MKQCYKLLARAAFMHHDNLKRHATLKGIKSRNHTNTYPIVSQHSVCLFPKDNDMSIWHQYRTPFTHTKTHILSNHLLAVSQHHLRTMQNTWLSPSARSSLHQQNMVLTDGNDILLVLSGGVPDRKWFLSQHALPLVTPIFVWHDMWLQMLFDYYPNIPLPIMYTILFL